MVWRKKLRQAEQYMVFSQQMGHLLESGIPLLTCLELLTSQRIITKQDYHQLIDSLQNGHDLSSALKKLFFPPMYISFIRAAEEHGDYVLGFKQCAAYYATKAKWQRELKEACTYPLMVLLLAICAFVFMFAVVMPRFSHLYETMGITLPFLTRQLFHVYSFMPVFVFWGAILLLAILVSARVIKYVPCSVRGWWESIWLYLPIIRQLYQYRHTHYVTVHLASLLKAGVSLVDALDVIQNHTPWPVLVRHMEKVKEELLKGEPFSKALRQKAKYVFLPSFAKMAALAEESGQLDQTLTSLADGTGMMIRYKLERFTKTLEPAFIFTIGLLIAVTVVALFMPLLKLVQAL